jgi:transcriptional regulator PpsR
LKRSSPVRATLDPEEAQAAAALVVAAMDVALVVDRNGVIREVTCSIGDLRDVIDNKWRGRPWTDTVTTATRPKIEALLKDAAQQAEPRWRQVNHPSGQGSDIPISYSAVRVGGSGRIMVVGRDLRPVAMLQQRLVNAQQSVEREHAKLRHAETRYRMLCQIASEAVLVIDASSGRVVEANPAAADLLKAPMRRLVGHLLVEHFDGNGHAAFESLLAAARVAGRSDEVRVGLADGSREFRVSASLFREDLASYLLVRAAPIAMGAAAPATTGSRVLGLVARLPDGFVVTDGEGRILSANRAFLDMAELSSEQQALNATLDRWLGRPGVDLNVLLTSLREHGTVRMFSTAIQGSHGSQADVEICAVAALRDEDASFAFSIRNVSSRLSGAPRRAKELPRSVKQMTELVGRVPLKELVRETTDMIERQCIEAALELSKDNRATAADLLGLSRQSLYVKMHRYGLGALDQAETVTEASRPAVVPETRAAPRQ